MDSANGHDGVTSAWAHDILDFWFKHVGEEGWWSHRPALDAECAERFAGLWNALRNEDAETFLARGDEALAAIILFDQLPRNMFRGKAEAFATDPLARMIARGAIARGYDIQIGGKGRQFFYMPFQHSEDMGDQALSLQLFGALGDERALSFARQHCDIIHRYGRFPHRNAALGRPDRAEEGEAIAQGAGW